MRIRNINFNILGYASASILGLVALALLLPTVDSSVHATEYCKGDNGYVECDASGTVATYAHVASVVSLGVQSNVVMDVVPKSTGVVTQTPVSLRVSTNSPEGYSLYMKTMGETNALTNMNGSESRINPIEGQVSVPDMSTQDNVWGYSIGSSSDSDSDTNRIYQAVPMSQDQAVYRVDHLVEDGGDDVVDLSFASNITTSLPAGTYSNSVLISAVANPVTITNLSELVFMQDMSTDICANTAYDASGTMDVTSADIANPVTKQLIDTRDGKKYWVSKLADGNCWMVQNLALDLSTERTLTPSDTDVESEWRPNSNTDAIELTGVSDDIGQHNQYSWGKWKNTVLATPLFGRLCDSSRGNSSSIISSEELYDICSGEGFYNTEGFMPTYKTQEGMIVLSAGNNVDRQAKIAENGGGGDVSIVKMYPYTYKGLVAIDQEAQTYDAHYLVGNYYQFNAATAGTGGASLTNANATSSICPKGWTLPRSGNESTIIGSLNSNNGTFYNLLNAYGVASKVSSEVGDKSTTLRNYAERLTATTVVDGVTATYNIAANQFNIAASPLYFVRGGNVSMSNGSVRPAGVNGYAWSRSSNAVATTAYLLRFDASIVLPSDGPHQRWSGASVRCLAR